MLRGAAGSALAALAGDPDAGPGADGAAGLAAAAGAALGAGAGVAAELDAIAARVRALEIEAGDIAGALRDFVERIDAEPGRLEAVEERLAAFERLERKHGGSIESVLAHADRLRGEIERLDGASELAADLEARLREARKRRAELAGDLTATRGKAAGKLGGAVAAELGELAMDGARLEVALVPEPDGLGPVGAERVELSIALNPGLPSSPLRDAASGGELSRLMLALSVVASAGRANDASQTLVFDEIDAGIGGHAARAVGERLRSLSGHRQTLCITHLPRVASLASAHFVVSKRTGRRGSVATVERVEGDAVVAEICRMLGAEAGDEAASRHARELLAAAA